jgi:uncharacterized protein (TIGR00266 family)
MKYQIRYKPMFSAIFVRLDPGDSIIAEAGAMASMNAELSMATQFSGGFFNALLRKFFGGETLFVNQFTNKTRNPLTLVLTQAVIGDIEAIELKGKPICFQPGAYIAHTPGVNMSVNWAGFKSWFAREGLFKLKLSGNGTVFFGAYGGITKKRISGEFIVDTSHLVAYEPSIQMGIGLAGSLIGSFTSGEGFVNRLSGNGIIYLQSRSMDGLVKFLRPKFR